MVVVWAARTVWHWAAQKVDERVASTAVMKVLRLAVHLAVL